MRSHNFGPVFVSFIVLFGASLIAIAQPAPPFNVKVYGSATVGVGGTTTLDLTINNVGTTTLTAVTGSDTLPADQVIATPNGLLSACTPGSSLGTITAVAGTNLITIGTSTILAAGACTVQVNVTGTAPGALPNVFNAADAVVGAGNPAVGVLTVLAIGPPTIAKAFGTSPILLGATTSLKFTITAPNALTNVNFTDFLPAGLVVATPPVLTNTCGGVAAAASGGNTVSLTGGSFAAAGTCTITVNVTGVAPGIKVNSVTVSDAVAGIGNTATATLLVLAIPNPVNNAVPDAYQINYLPAQVGGGIAGGYIDISNAGELGADAFGPLSGTTGRICVNVYVFTADEQESECCSCLVTPNALVRLTAADLIGNPGNGVTPTLGVVVKLLATIPGATSATAGTNTQATFTGSACNAALPFTSANLAPGMVALATKFHTNSTTTPASVSLTETPFSNEALSPTELTKLTNLCQFLAGNQSGAGLCKACSLGGLGAGRR